MWESIFTYCTIVSTFQPNLSESFKVPLEFIVLDLVSRVRIAVLMNVYLGLGNSKESGFWNEGYMSQGREMEGLVYEQPEDNVDESCHNKEGSK